jgi:hypothetical protein
MEQKICIVLISSRNRPEEGREIEVFISDLSSKDELGVLKDIPSSSVSSTSNSLLPKNIMDKISNKLKKAGKEYKKKDDDDEENEDLSFMIKYAFLGRKVNPFTQRNLFGNDESRRISLKDQLEMIKNPNFRGDFSSFKNYGKRGSLKNPSYHNEESLIHKQVKVIGGMYKGHYGFYFFFFNKIFLQISERRNRYTL